MRKHERSKCQWERKWANAERDQMKAEEGESGYKKISEYCLIKSLMGKTPVMRRMSQD